MSQAAHPSLADRVEELMNSAPHVALPVPEVASRVGVSPATLLASVQEDDRFVVVHPAVFPDLAILSRADRCAYDDALRSAGVHGTQSIALRHPGSGSGGNDVDDLLRDSVARLLVRTPEAALVAAAERMRAAVNEVIAPGPDPDGTAPSTTPPPDPLAGTRDPPRKQPRPPARPPYLGSRRG